MLTSLQSSIEAVRRVMDALPIEFVMSDLCPMDELMHALTTMQLVERERAEDTAAE